jgi:hypothetical protein
MHTLKKIEQKNTNRMREDACGALVWRFRCCPERQGNKMQASQNQKEKNDEEKKEGGGLKRGRLGERTTWMRAAV